MSPERILIASEAVGLGRAAQYAHAGVVFDRPIGGQAAKFLAADACFNACENAFLTRGGMGYAKEYHASSDSCARRVFRGSRRSACGSFCATSPRRNGAAESVLYLYARARSVEAAS